MLKHWSLALSNSLSHVFFYRSSIPTGDNQTDSGEQLQHQPMWETVHERNELATAWAETWAAGTPQQLICRAKRNGRRFILRLWKIPEHDNPAIISHGEWFDDAREKLSELEYQVCHQLTSGRTITAAAAALQISTRTAQRLRSSAMSKLNCTTPEQLGSRFR